MKKIIYLFVLGLFIILPMNVEAEKVEKNICRYLTNDLRADMIIYDDNNDISAEVTLYKFGVNQWTGGNSKKIEVSNYSTSTIENDIKLAEYRNNKSYSCPRYLLMIDDSKLWGAISGYGAYVEDEKRDLSTFAQGFDEKENYIAEFYTGSSNKYRDAKCTYDNSYIVAEGMEVPKISFTLDILNDQVVLGGVSEYIGNNYVVTKVNAEHHINIENFKDKCYEKIWYTVEKEPTCVNENLHIGCVYENLYTFYTNPENVNAMSGYLNIAGIKDPITGEEIEGGDTYDPEYDDDDYIKPGVGIELKEGCDVISNDLKSWLIQLLDLIKIGGLILTLILGMTDFFKGVTSGEADAMKKVWKSFANRLIAVIILFLLPLIIEFLFGLINISGINSSNPLCGIK